MSPVYQQCYRLFVGDLPRCFKSQVREKKGGGGRRERERERERERRHRRVGDVCWGNVPTVSLEPSLEMRLQPRPHPIQHLFTFPPLNAFTQCMIDE